jgi:hypothetical protein
MPWITLRAKHRGTLWSVLTAVLVALAGCSTSQAPPADGDDTSTPSLTAPSLNETNRKAIDDAIEAYFSLRDTMSAEEARAKLVGDLNADSNGLADAELCADGYTIWLNFHDGQVAAINSVEMFGAEEETESAKRDAPVDASMALLHAQRLRTLAQWPAGPVQTPKSRKVLLMSPAAENFAGADFDVFEEIVDELIGQYNWDARDITIKRNEFADDYATINFYDFFRLGDYGVIVILAHGIFRDAAPPGPVVAPPAPTSSPTDPDDPFDFGFRVRSDTIRYFYIQVGAEWSDPTTDGDPFDFGFRTIAENDFDVTEEIRRGRIILVRQLDVFQRTQRSYYYMREDLWAEHMEELPASIVYVCAPNQFRSPWVAVDQPPPAPTPSPTEGDDPFNFGFRVIADGEEAPRRTSVLVQRGAASVVGWDRLVPGRNALDAVRFITDMAAGDFSDIQALVQASYDTVVHVTAEFDFWEAQFSAMSSTIEDDLHTFLPTWADVSFARTPTGTITTTVKIEYEDASVPLPNVTLVEDIPNSVHELEGLFPGVRTRFTAKALDASGRELASKEKVVTLHAGGNTVTFDDWSANAKPEELEVPITFVRYGPIRVHETHLIDDNDTCGEWIIYGYAYTWETPDQEKYDLISWRYGEGDRFLDKIPYQMLQDGTSWHEGTDFVSLMGIDPESNYNGHFYASGLCFCTSNNCQEDRRMSDAQAAMDVHADIVTYIVYQYTELE